MDDRPQPLPADSEALELSDQQFASGTVGAFSGDPMIFSGSTLLTLGRVDEARTILQGVLDEFGKRGFAAEHSRFLEFAETGHIADDLFELRLVDIDTDNPDGSFLVSFMIRLLLFQKLATRCSMLGTPRVWFSLGARVPSFYQNQGLCGLWWLGFSGRSVMFWSKWLSNPLVQLRFGQVEYELGHEAAAREALLSAYVIAGDEVFGREDGRYLDFLRSRVTYRVDRDGERGS